MDLYVFFAVVVVVMCFGIDVDCIKKKKQKQIDAVYRTNLFRPKIRNWFGRHIAMGM